MPMVALFNFLPKFCPNCNKVISLADIFAKDAYLARRSHTCRHCGLYFQYTKTMSLLVVAQSTGGNLFSTVLTETADTLSRKERIT